MPKVPSSSPVTGQPTPDYYIHTLEGHFVDNEGRTLLLRGVNLSGDSKFPVGSASHRLNIDAAEAGKENFVGRPLRLEDADVHLARLRGWGMKVLRYVIPWEALEHAGPGIYDEEFIDHTLAILRKCKAHGFKVWINPHQDVWSRFSGGSGAPYWTLHAGGLNPRNFSVTGSLIHAEWPNPSNPDPLRFPIMSWPTGYYHLPSQTMFTLFWAGRDLAPKCIIDGKNIQDYLQGHFLEAFGHLADRVRDAGGLLDECVIGWESMNEPSEGFIGIQDLNVAPSHQILRKEASPTPAQGIRLGSGIPQAVDFWSFSQVGPIKTNTVNINPEGKTVWLNPENEPNGVSTRWKWKRADSWKLGQCIWAQHGLWDPKSGEMMVPGYFHKSREHPWQKVDFVKEYWLPFWRVWSKRIRRSHPEAIHFIQPPLFTPPPKFEESDLSGRACYSPHYYDGLTMMTRRWNWFNSNTLAVLRNKLHVIQSFKFGEEAIRRNFQEQLAMFREDVRKGMGNFPIIVGETGTPFDMDEKKSYGRTDGGAHIGSYVNQTTALDASLNAADGKNIYNWAIWSYSPDHSWEHGDGFNREDLSIWSPDDWSHRQKVKQHQVSLTSSKYHLDSTTFKPSLGFREGPFSSTPDSATHHPTTIRDFLTDGARALEAFSRPYPLRTVGTPKEIVYSIANAEFKLTVLVGAKDAPPPPIGGPEAPADAIEERASGRYTEIFVPMTSFSSESSSSNGANAPDENIGKSTDSLPRKQPRSFGRSSKRIKKDLRHHSKVIEGVYQLHSSMGGSMSEAGSASSLILPIDIPLPLNIPPNVLDAEVTASAGDWEVDGQIVRWSYPIPPEGSFPREYSILIRKRRLETETQPQDEGCRIM